MVKQIFVFLSLALMLSSCAELQSIVDSTPEVPLTRDEVARGLKEALSIGISNGSEALSKLDGYYKGPYKILLPEEARKITDKLKVIPGFKDVEEVIVQKLNRAAEDAASKAKPIFVDAITGMTIADVWGILRGADNAATVYLHGQTNDALTDAFQPVILESLNKFNAVEYWDIAVTAYNKLPFVNQMNPKLDEYVTEKALDGLFDMVEKEEKAIREDVSRRTTDLLKKVFAKQDT